MAVAPNAKSDAANHSEGIGRGIERGEDGSCDFFGGLMIMF